LAKRKLPILKPAEVVTRLVSLGFEEVRQKGSHKQFRHSDGRCTTVPIHRGRDISPILLPTTCSRGAPRSSYLSCFPSSSPQSSPIPIAPSCWP